MTTADGAGTTPRREIVRRLRELIAALDRRAPHAGGFREPAILRDAARLRRQAVQQLGILEYQTPFPATPSEVVPLKADEFVFHLDPAAEPSVDLVRERFPDDANRAVVWLIRFSALRAWSRRSDVTPWLTCSPARLEQACHTAASFALNQSWEFDAEAFRAAVNRAGESRD